MGVVQRGSVLTLTGAAASDQFGSATALSQDGTILVVGVRNSNAQKGEVVVYDLVSGAWSQRGGAITAADGAAYDSFGDAVALSGNGLVLAVGAPGWEGAATDQGGVYIFDWSGSAWVQRGSVLTAGDAAASDAFGDAVALSSDGAILAVGASGWEGAATDQGGVYIFDWSGSVWTQRGSVLTAGDAVASDMFGTGVALSATGTVLAVGAQRRASGGTYRGGVYTYDYSAGVWTQRGSVLTAGDAANYDAFGSTVGLSGNGLVLAVGAIRWKANGYMGHAYLYDVSGAAWAARTDFSGADSVSGDSYTSGLALSNTASVLAVGAMTWEGALTDQGGVYTYDVTPGDIVSAPTSLTVNASTVTLSAPTTLYAATAAVSIGYTSLTVAAPSGIASAPTKLSMTANGSAVAPTALALVDASQHWPLWGLRVVIDGVDVSARLTGQANVECDEGAARVAKFSLLPAAGIVAPLDYVGKPVSIDYLQSIAGATVARRLFTGRIDTPQYSPDSQQLDLSCVDDLQNRVAELDRAVIDTLVGGKYTPAIQGEILDNWAYAKARLTTVAGSLDAGPHGELRVTPWSIATIWATFGAADLKYPTSSVTYPQRSTLVNQVQATFEYRYPRLRQRYTSAGWSGTQIDMAPCGYQYPRQQDILGAAGGTGWTVTLGVFYPAPAAIPHSSGGFVYPAEGSIDMAILHLAQRHSQTVTETFTLTVSAPESMAANGTLPQTLRGALASRFDGGAWESALDVAPLMPTGGEMDYAPDAPRADADYAIETLLDQANVKILGSHRSARVGNAMLCNPDLDLDKKVAIATPSISAAGKVARVRHVFDIDAGSAVTEFEIAAFGVGGAGIITPDTLAAPAPPAAAVATQNWAADVPSMSVNTYGVTPYTDSLMGLLLNPPETITVENIPGVGSKSFPNPYYAPGSYPATGFRMQMPGVSDADRNPLDKAVASAYQIIIPSDTLTFIVA